MMMVSFAFGLIFKTSDSWTDDVDDEENLRRHAARGAQAAIRAAKDRAQAFDDDRGQKAEKEEALDRTF